jgi:hypothetical protein
MGSTGAPATGTPSPGGALSPTLTLLPSAAPAGGDGFAAAMAPGAVAGAAVGGSVAALALLVLAAWLLLCRAKGPPAKSIVKMVRGGWRPGAGAPATAVVSNPLTPREVELAAMAPPPPPAALTDAAAPALPPGWVQMGPDAEGDTWYVNEETKQSLWEPPQA